VPSALRTNNPLILKYFKLKTRGKGDPGNYKIVKTREKKLQICNMDFLTIRSSVGSQKTFGIGQSA
jgi:hypothetical protein